MFKCLRNFICISLEKATFKSKKSKKWAKETIFKWKNRKFCLAGAPQKVTILLFSKFGSCVFVCFASEWWGHFKEDWVWLINKSHLVFYFNAFHIQGLVYTAKSPSKQLTNCHYIGILFRFELPGCEKFRLLCDVTETQMAVATKVAKFYVFMYGSSELTGKLLYGLRHSSSPKAAGKVSVGRIFTSKLGDFGGF